MPRIKRWFAVSQDINSDPQFLELGEKFGVAGIRVWLEVLSILDRTDNFWDLHKDFNLRQLSNKCGTIRKTCSNIVEHLIGTCWVVVGLSPEHKMYLYAPNWLKYNKTRDDKGNFYDTLRNPKYVPTRPIPNPTINSSSKEEELIKEKGHKNDPKRKDAPAERAARDGLFEMFWQGYPPRNGKRLNKPETQRLFATLSPDDQLLCVTAARHYAGSQRVRDGIGIKDPNRFIRGGKGEEPWKDWVEAEVVTVRPMNGHSNAAAQHERLRASMANVLKGLTDD